MRVKLCGEVVDDDSAKIYRYFDYGVCCPADVRAALEACPEGEDLTLEVNSNGGSVYAGFEMYTLLRAHQGRTIAEVQSIAASAMSVVIAACDTVLMSPVAEIMVHRASIGYTGGNSQDLKQTAQWLDTIDQSILSAYEEKVKGKADRAKLSRMMRNETFLTAEDAISCGLADGMLEQPEKQTESGGLEMELFPGLAVASAGAETLGAVMLDKDGKARPFKEVLEELSRRISGSGLFLCEPLPPVNDLIRRKEEREEAGGSRQEEVQNKAEGKEQEEMAENGVTAQTPQTTDQLIQQYPELTRQIAAAAAQTAAAAERKRIAEIDALSLPGFEDVIARAKADPNATAGTVAQEIVKAQRESGTAYLNGRDADAKVSNVNDVPATGNPDTRTSGASAEDELGAAAREAVALWRSLEGSET